MAISSNISAIQFVVHQINNGMKADRALMISTYS